MDQVHQMSLIDDLENYKPIFVNKNFLNLRFKYNLPELFKPKLLSVDIGNLCFRRRILCILEANCIVVSASV